ncbi:class I SAM-dependent methyltransferase [Paramesorhizobium deserti]|uniref:class I SAM-dependent methyltransferase n=1 Tax=Paramesorhizobium deserti TaxID=1494590 RepID=UPI0009EABB68|nr:class I SAM-dependent methyltransferase [Paramesorhizobium deserti]
MNGTQGYQDSAKTLAQQYESITFSDVHRDVLHFFPSRPSVVLDIGAGSGRDAAALAAKGHAVTAVEPTEALRNEGMRLHKDKAIEWIDDQLPDLARLQTRGESFDLILLTAVWMHLSETERQVSMNSLVKILTANGRVSMSLRHGPVPSGRRMFDVSPDETVALASSHGLGLVHRVEREDMLGRPDVRWNFIVFEKR